MVVAVVLVHRILGLDLLVHRVHLDHLVRLVHLDLIELEQHICGKDFEVQPQSLSSCSLSIQHRKHHRALEDSFRIHLEHLVHLVLLVLQVLFDTC